MKNSIKEEFDSETVYNEKHLKTNWRINTNFTIIKYQKKVLNVFFYQ